MTTGNNTESEKVQLPGRRRLCKSHHEPGPEEEEGKEENISDILDEFSFRFESLSLTKEKHSKDERPAVEEACFSSKEKEEGGEFDDNFEEEFNVDNYKIVPRNMKNCYFSDEEEAEVIDGVEVVEEKVTVNECCSDEEDVVEVQELTKGNGKNDYIIVADQGAKVKASTYRSMGRTTKQNYFSDEEEIVEVEEITRLTDLPASKSVSEKENGEEDKSDFTLEGTQEGKVRVYMLANKVYGKLYTHQRDGIKWLWGLHCKGTGGILGDDMGLGKTMQVCNISLVFLFRIYLFLRHSDQMVTIMRISPAKLAS